MVAAAESAAYIMPSGAKASGPMERICGPVAAATAGGATLGV
jgi:hypothetical protein